MSIDMEQFTQRVLFGIASHAAVREPQTSTQRKNPNLSILRILRSLTSGRTLTVDVHVTPQLPLPYIFSLHRSGTFLNPRDWSTTATARCLTAHPACWGGGRWLRVPFSSEKEHRVSWYVSQSYCKRGYVLQLQFTQHMCCLQITEPQSRATNSLHALASPNSWRNKEIPLLMHVFRCDKNGKTVARLMTTNTNRMGALRGSSFFTIKSGTFYCFASG